MKKMKKIFCMAIALVMLLSLCPTVVLADESVLIIGDTVADVPQTEVTAPAAETVTATVAEPAAETPVSTAAQPAAHVHSYEVASYTAPTCTAKGYALYMCSCGDKYVVEIPKAEHKFVNGVCTVCNAADPNYTAAAAEATEEIITEAPAESNTVTEQPAAEAEVNTNEEALAGSITVGETLPQVAAAAPQAATQDSTSATETDKTEEETNKEEDEEPEDANTEDKVSLNAAAPQQSQALTTAGDTTTQLQSDSGTTTGIIFQLIDHVLHITGNTGEETLEGKESEFSTDKTAIESALETSKDKKNDVFSVVVEKIKTIGKFAFTGLKNLQVIFIGEDTEEIESGAFAGTTELDAIIVDDDNENYDDEFGVLYTKDKTELVAVPADKDGAIPINPNVTKVDDYAFAYSDLTDAYFLGNAPEFESADGKTKHTFEGTGTTIRHACWNLSWYNPTWIKETFFEKPFVATASSISAYHYPVVTKAGVKPTETEFGLSDELRCRVCGALIQSQTKIWPNGKADSGVYSFDSITSVPTSLQSNEKYNTVDKIKTALKQEVAAEYQSKAEKTMPESCYKAYDVKLVSGAASGPYVVTIPYPTGVGPEHYDFVCVHLNNNGNMEKLDVFETNRGLQVTVSDLSPFGFAWYYNDVDP